MHLQVKHKLFKALKADIASAWHALPPKADVFSPALRAKMRTNMDRMNKSQLSRQDEPRQEAAHHT